MRRNGFVALLAGIVLLGGFSASFADEKEPSSEEYYELMKVFVDTFQQIEQFSGTVAEFTVEWAILDFADMAASSSWQDRR